MALVASWIVGVILLMAHGLAPWPRSGVRGEEWMCHTHPAPTPTTGSEVRGRGWCEMTEPPPKRGAYSNVGVLPGLGGVLIPTLECIAKAIPMQFLHKSMITCR